MGTSVRSPQIRATRRPAFWARVGGAALLLLTAATAPLPAQTGIVTGTVIDSRTQQPLAGAQVTVQGTERRALTNARGEFRIAQVPGTQVTLQAQMLGYSRASEPATVGGPAVRISLTEAAIELDAIVVTGTAGGEQKRAIGNVVTQIDAAKLTEVAPVQDVGSMLNARAPGVVVMPGTGMVGAGQRIRIRGSKSFSLSDQPLIYVDGVRLNNQVSSGPTVQGFGGAAISRLGDINPNDIASIEVIKGPAAATLYGTEAANGVIQIITKRGRAGDRPQINLTTRQGANWFANAEERINEAYYRDPQGNVQTMNLVQLERERGTPIWTTGHLSGYGIDVNGGSDALRYFVSGTYDRDNGIEPTNKLRRFTGRMNLEFDVRENFDISTNLGLIRATTDLARENGGTWFDARLGDPRFLDTPQRGFWRRPPEIVWAAHRDWQDLNRFIAGTQLNHRPFGWFSQRVTLGLDVTAEANQSLTPYMAPELAAFYTGEVPLGSKSNTQRDVTYSTVDYSGTAKFDPTESLNSATSVGLQYYRTLITNTVADGRLFPAPDLSTISATAITIGSDSLVENSTVGVYLQQQFGWRNRVFLTGALRADDNSAFGENFSLVTYPKLSATWVVDEEPFFSVPFVDALKLRFAFGASGQQPESFAALRTYQPITTGVGAAGVTPQFIGNPDLKPERGEELEVGFESGLFNNRVGVDFTYYSQRTRDAILLRTQPPSLGFPGAQYVNAGEISNSGLELQLTGLAFQTDRTQLDLTANVSTNRNRVEDLGGLEFIAIGASQQHRVGYPAGAWFDRRVVSADVNAAGVASNVLCDDGAGGSVACVDAPRVYIGRSQPNLEGAFSATLSLFERLSFYASADYKRGYLKDDTERNGRCVTRRICEENLFPQENPVFTAEVQDPLLPKTNIRMHDASFMKLREVSAAYTLPDSWAGRIGASRANIRVAGRNLYTWSEWLGLDPESYRMNQLFSRGEQEAMPQLATFLATLNLSF